MSYELKANDEKFLAKNIDLTIKKVKLYELKKMNNFKTFFM